MNVADLLNISINFISKWAGTTVPRIIIAFMGILCIILTIIAISERRVRIVSGVFLLISGVLMAAVALDPRIPYYFAETSYLIRIRILMVTLSFVVMVITIEAIRRSHLQERYALLWIGTSVIIFIAALFPQLLDLARIILGTQYVTAVMGIIFTFLLLIAFHFSISLSSYNKKQTNIAQQCAILEERITELNRQITVQHPDFLDKSIPPEQSFQAPIIDDKQIETSQLRERIDSIKGSRIAIPTIIGIVFTSVLIIGWMTPQPMVGDEITHFYMLTTQAENLSEPNFFAKIPTGWGAIEVRRYPHPFLWHYIGATIFLLSGNSFYAVQFYQCLFFLQLLIVAYLLAKSRPCYENRSAILYVIVIASLPVSILFSVTFYQDIPLTAQILTAFYFLRKKHHLMATLFMCLAIGIKLTAILFLPAFYAILILEGAREKKWFQISIQLLISIVIIFSFSWSMQHALKTYARTNFYPVKIIHRLIKSIDFKKTSDRLAKAEKQAEIKSERKRKDAKTKKLKPITPYETDIIANHPGDLRIPKNFIVYFGIVIWIVLIFVFISIGWVRFGEKDARKKISGDGWFIGIGVSYIALTAYFLRSAPDARFFLPGLPFIILPLTERALRLPRSKILFATITALAVLQGGFVLAKTYQLRNVTPETREAIDYLAQTQPNSTKIFMYPEGNYRLFPLRHEWYLRYKLREFWRADNNLRIKMLNQNKTFLIVIKKHLIAPVSEDIINLGVYPDYFVREVESDARFKKLFDNKGIAIYQVPTAFSKL